MNLLGTTKNLFANFLIVVSLLVASSMLSSCSICLNPDDRCKWEHERDWLRYIDTLEKQATAGKAIAQRNLGTALLTKSNSSADDYLNITYGKSKGIEWLEKAVLQKEPLALYILGHALVTGALPIRSGPLGRDLREPKSEIKRDFDRGMDLMAQASQSRCNAYGNATIEINQEIASFYAYSAYQNINAYQNDTWRLRHWLYCESRQTYPAHSSFTIEQRGRFAGTMSVVDYYRLMPKESSKPKDINLSFPDKNKLLLLSKKYEDGGWDANEITNYSEKLIEGVINLNLRYPLLPNFVVTPKWD